MGALRSDVHLYVLVFVLWIARDRNYATAITHLLLNKKCPFSSASLIVLRSILPRFLLIVSAKQPQTLSFWKSPSASLTILHSEGFLGTYAWYNCILGAGYASSSMELQLV